MAHHKQKIQITSDGRERRVLRDRKASKTKLTRGGQSYGMLTDPDPTGARPTTGWVLGHYPIERRRRRRRAEYKRIDRRAQLTREERIAFDLARNS